jgi:hypothetical protein
MNDAGVNRWWLSAHSAYEYEGDRSGSWDKRIADLDYTTGFLNAIQQLKERVDKYYE